LNEIIVCFSVRFWIVLWFSCMCVHLSFYDEHFMICTSFLFVHSFRLKAFRLGKRKSRTIMDFEKIFRNLNNAIAALWINNEKKNMKYQIKSKQISKHPNMNNKHKTWKMKIKQTRSTYHDFSYHILYHISFHRDS
jgi:hypothetical protein